MRTKISPLTKRDPSRTKLPAFSLLELILSIALLALIVGGVFGNMVLNVESTRRSGDLSRATFLAEEALESVRNIRDDDYNLLTDGTYGIGEVNGKVSLLYAPDTLENFTRQVTIGAVENNLKSVTARVTWLSPSQEQRSTEIPTYLSNWKITRATQADGLSVDISGSSVGDEGNKKLRDITLTNNSGRDITIDKITVTWTTNAMIERIKIDEDDVWAHNDQGSPDGKQTSGTLLDIINFNIEDGEDEEIREMKFDKDMSDAVFTITMTMIDGSQKTVSDFNP